MQEKTYYFNIQDNKEKIKEVNIDYQKIDKIIDEVKQDLNEIAKEYDVTYPTVRLRLDRLIQKIKVCDEMDNDPYIALVKRFAVDEKIDFDTAKRLIAEYKKQVEKGGKWYDTYSYYDNIGDNFMYHRTNWSIFND